MNVNKVSKNDILLLLIVLCASFALYQGWQLFWYLTDDAYIFFRYISNSQLGYGYTWNIPPFRPVEGYTSFLWVLILDIVWRVFGIEPPESANTIALISAYGTLFLAITMLLKLPLRPELNLFRPVFMVLALIGILSNRTFLAWTSSGLETALFNFLFTSWVFIALFTPSSHRFWLFGLALTASLTTLTRPDGLLLIATTILLIFLQLHQTYKTASFKLQNWVISFIPLLVVLAHLLWRKTYYGEWLPNTFVAKSDTIWIESGVKYALSFIIEYSLWFWLLLVVLASWYFVKKIPQILGPHLFTPAIYVPVGVLATLITHFCYYTFIIGGDHFEYRVYSHLIVFIFVSTIWLINQINLKPFWAIAYLSLFLVCSWPIPWTHWALSQPLTTREETHPLLLPVADYFPGFIKPYVQIFDEFQFWLIKHGVCIRHQTHKIFVINRTNLYAQREKTLLISPKFYPTFVVGAVGVISWQMPTVNIIDWLGLNDYVVARNPTDPNYGRYMAHNRFPPQGYIACFEPNFKAIADNKFVVGQRTDLPETIIKNCENTTWPPRYDHPTAEAELNLLDNLELAQVAPDIEKYLWSVWPADPSYIYFVPPTQTPLQELPEVSQQFITSYEGLGCIVFPPAEAQTTPYFYTFLTSTNRPPLPAVQTLFPWAEVVTEQYLTNPFPYHIAYMAPRPTTTPNPAQPLTQSWENGLQLVGFDVPQITYKPGETVLLTLHYFHNGSTLPDNFSFFTHLIGPAGLVTQDDGEICRGVYPVSFWQPATTVLHKIVIKIPENTPAGTYSLQTGLYNWAANERIPFINSVPDHAFHLINIEVK